jgi:hypothetical protein
MWLSLHRFEKQYMVNEVEVHGPVSTSRVFLPDVAPDLRTILCANDAAPVVPGMSTGGTAVVKQGNTPPRIRPVTVDEKGRALATGRRKSAIARVWVSFGVGDMMVNGLPLGRYFGKAALRAAALTPFTVLLAPKDYNVVAKVAGGGAILARCCDCLHWLMYRARRAPGAVCSTCSHASQQL